MEIISTVILMLVMLNPMDKIFLLLLLRKKHKFKDLSTLIFQSNFIALFILLLFAISGTFVLKDIFHIDINALKVAGGIILLFIGKNQLEKGEGFTIEKRDHLFSMAASPFAVPLIAGPAAITTVITLSSIDMGIVIISTFFALSINTLLMLLGLHISEKADHRIINAVIRIIGLFIMSIGVQMVLTGIKTFFLL